MHRRDMLLGLGATGFALAGCTAPSDDAVRVPANTTLIMVRHGEKSGLELTRPGQERAAALAQRLVDVPLDRVYSTSYKRNVLTAQPVADQKGLEVETVADFDVAPQILAGNGGKTILWVGNKGNLSQMWEAMGLPDPAPLEYGDIAFVRADGQGRVSVSLERFGA
ncbi:Histidine phosphatase superfamily (branch 1) [Roseivivax lentus]|uniref:Histidine phosphatase superfamily (Branch 1) n=1 Tax=Roseivivax lentus TaxID=633194 RepID=A0A1N7PVU7_9RHOB|nr:histidine phosphatase family protein [Roseivivax lentus]SIT14783.1 Histidine phosphatase superfamily (branch 1) [Roseivivax lentus]